MRINHLRTNTEENVLQDNVSKNKKKLQKLFIQINRSIHFE